MSTLCRLSPHMSINMFIINSAHPNTDFFMTVADGNDRCLFLEVIVAAVFLDFSSEELMLLPFAEDQHPQEDHIRRISRKALKLFSNVYIFNKKNEIFYQHHIYSFIVLLWLTSNTCYNIIIR